MASSRLPPKSIESRGQSVAGYVFVSYSRRDKHYVDRLVTYLRDHGIDVWYDQEIATAERWFTVIQNRIDNCSVFLVVMTPDSDESRWVMMEYQRAMDLKRPIVPLLLAGEPFMALRDIQHYRVDNHDLPGPDFVDTIRALLPIGATTSRRAITGTQAWHVAIPGDPTTISIPDVGTISTTFRTHTYVTTKVLPVPVAVAYSPRSDVVAAGRSHTISIVDVQTGALRTSLVRPIQLPAPMTPERSQAGSAPTTFRLVISLTWLPGERLGAVWLVNGSASNQYEEYYQYEEFSKGWIFEAGIWTDDKTHVTLWTDKVEVSASVGYRWNRMDRAIAAWDQTGRRLAICQTNGRVLVHDSDPSAKATAGASTLADQEYARSLSRPWEARLAWSPDGRWLAVSGDHDVGVWDVQTGAHLYRMGKADSIAWAPNGTYLAGAHHSSVRIWHVETGTEIYTLNGHTQRINALAYSPDGQYLATGGDDQTVRIWRPNAGEFACLLIGHTAPVTSLSWGPDSTTLVSGGHDGARMWRLIPA